MDRLMPLARRISQYGVWFSGVLLLAAAVLVAVDVAIRKLFNLSVGGADSLSGYTLAITVAFGLGFALLDRAHIRIDSLYSLLPRRVCAVLDLVSLLTFIFFMAYLTWYAFGVWQQTLTLNARSMSPLSTPLIIPQTLWLIGLIQFQVIALLLAVRAIAVFTTGDINGVQQLIGSRTVNEEIEEEVGEVERD